MTSAIRRKRFPCGRRTSGRCPRSNGRRIFIKCCHTATCFPDAPYVNCNTERMRRQLLYFKSCGFNAIRYIFGTSYPEMMDLCDEIGLMVYEEHVYSWLAKSSARTDEFMVGSCRSVLERDRNHAYLRFDMENWPRTASAYDCVKEHALGFRKFFDEWRLNAIWPTPEEFVADSQAYESRQRRLLTAMARRNPHINGYSITMGMDKGFRGEGLTETDGTFKRGTSDMLQDCCADLMFCIIAHDSCVFASAGAAVQADGGMPARVEENMI